MHFNLDDDDRNIIATRLKDDNCPSCRMKLNAATGVNEDEIPRPNDISICIHCAEILEFDKNLRLKVFTVEQRNNLSAEELDSITLAQQFVLKQKRLH